MATISFAEWAPDIAHLNSKFSADIMNVLMAADGAIPFPQLAPFSAALSEEPTGGFTARDSSGTVHIFIGTKTKLWRLDNTDMTWDDVSRTGDAYDSTTSERWRFAQFGDYVVAVNINDEPQVFQIGISTEFADLAGSPPKARFVAVWGDFLVLLCLASYPNRIHWSGLNDIEEWTPGTANCDYQEFPDGGDVQGATNATNPIIFQKQAIRMGTFVPGSPIVFTFQKVHDRRGAAAPYSIVSRGEFTFFADSGGFFRISPDGGIASIGREKVDRTIFGMIEGSTLADIYGEIDPFFSRVYWAVRAASTSAAFDRLVVYDWEMGRWTQIGGDFSILFPLSSGTIGYTLGSLGDLYATLADVPFPLGSNVWQGGAPVMAALDSNWKLGFFSGENAEAVIETAEMGATDGTVSFVDGLYPIVDTNDLYVSMGTRQKRGDPRVWGAEIAPTEATGRVDALCEARFYSFRVRIPEGVVWTSAQGIDVSAISAGYR